MCILLRSNFNIKIIKLEQIFIPPKIIAKSFSQSHSASRTAHTPIGLENYTATRPNLIHNDVF